jgi:hypothetical protein
VAAAGRNAVEGAAASAFTPTTSDESKLAGMGVSAVGGAAAPYLLKAAMAAGRGVRDAGRTVIAGFGSKSAAEARAANRVEEMLANAGVDAVPPPKYIPAPGLAQPSVAVGSQSPQLARLERGSRTSGGQHWQDFDEAQHAARWGALDKGLQTKGDLGAAVLNANRVGADVVSEGYQAADQNLLNRAMDDFYSKIHRAKETAAYHGTPAVKQAVDYVEKTLAGAGEVTPELLHKMRQTLSSGMVGTPGVGDQATRAAAKEPFILGITKDIDDVLQNSTAGGWNRWKNKYSDAMRATDAAKADVNIREKFHSDALDMSRKPVTEVGGDPVMTPHALRQAVAAAGVATRGPRKGTNLLRPESEQVLKDLIDNMDAQAIIQRSKHASTGGGGSDTASNVAQSLALEMMVPGTGVARAAFGAGKNRVNDQMQKQLAEALQDPATMDAILQRARAAALRRQNIATTPGMGVLAATPQME